MKLKKLLVPFLVLVVLVSLVLAKKLDEKKQAEEQKSSPSETVTLNADLSTAFVKKISLVLAGDQKSSVTIEKNQANDWVITSYYGVKARRNLIDQVLGKLTALKGELRADSQEVLGDFLLLETQALQVTLEGEGGKVLAQTLLSPMRPNAIGSNFVRAAGSSKVLVTVDDVLEPLGFYSKDSKLEQNNFADLKISSIQTTQIEKWEWIPKFSKSPLITVTKSGEGEAVKWTLEPGVEELDSSKVREFLNNAANLHALKVLDPSKDYGFGETPWLKLYSKAGTTPLELALYLGNQDPGDKSYPVKCMPDGYVFSVHESNLSNLLKKDRDSFSKPKPTTQTSAAPAAQK